MSMEAAKAAARQTALARRALCNPALGEAMAANILAYCPPASSAIVAAFISLPGEISTAPILAALHEKNFDICLPVTPRRGEPLTFRQWRPGDVMVAGRMGTQHTEGAEMVPDFILVPLLAFDRFGNRLGYGAGYYDRTLTQLPNAYRLGCAFAAQELDDVPAGPNDVRLHAIATEREVRRF
ncbi:MAG: 5-formyltetrahydrofolate cyclo-ligase [Acidocella sp. 20-57-95]|nr:MAG: 5-formyltetrahydrofolate cyclo-ligase [Acidocella sp. 20-57-95]OYV58897.1 MAG: 5-formyltetrahydrofolate cyclo-ligase [Acidocella sp. 21-58-7]HQT63389.1 5-formyltetrahydrofolate cyclo-ligase [Acidocella sp.]HQU05163.1 5-formyltetrahydrofolate cyclo-ligase [Acidocella sp.]